MKSIKKRKSVRKGQGMIYGPLAEALQEIGPIPIAFRFAVDVAYGRLRKLIATQEGVARWSVRSYRSIVHDEIWTTARDLLSDLEGCKFLIDEQAEILRFGTRYVFQVHKVDELGRVCDNGTHRPLSIQHQGYLWQSGIRGSSGDVWLTIGHRPNPFTHAAEAVIVGAALEGGMTEYERIEPNADAVSAISPRASELVARLRDLAG